MVSREQFIEQARTWRNVPHHHQGHSRYGADCIGLIIGVGLELGLDWRAFDIPHRSREPDGLSFLNAVAAACVPTDEPIPGDLLVFKIKRWPQHCALMTDKGMIHSYTTVDKVVETIYSDRWKSLLVQAFVLPLEEA